jgi:hypothetical protein
VKNFPKIKRKKDFSSRRLYFTHKKGKEEIFNNIEIEM